MNLIQVSNVLFDYIFLETVMEMDQDLILNLVRYFSRAN